MGEQEMSEVTTKLDDPIWAYTLNAKLKDYIPGVRHFWNNLDNIDVSNTGIYEMDNEYSKPGLMYRVTNTPARSPIKNVQAFPFVPVAYLQLVNVAGGANRMVSRVCANNKFKIDEFTVVEKSHLPSTYHQGQFVAFIPTDMLNSTKCLGKFVYLTLPEMIALYQNDTVPVLIRNKLSKFIK